MRNKTSRKQRIINEMPYELLSMLLKHERFYMYVRVCDSMPPGISYQDVLFNMEEISSVLFCKLMEIIPRKLKKGIPL